MSSSHLSPPQIATLYREGLSIREIMERDGRSHATIHRTLQQQGVVFRPRGGTKKRIPPETRAAIVAAYLADEPMAGICETYGVGDESVRRIVSEAGHPLRPTGGRRTLDVGQVDEMAGQGWSASSVAIMTGYSYGHVRRTMRRLGHGPASEWDVIEPEVAVEVYERTRSVRASARELGCSAGRVRRILADAGVEVRSTPGWPSRVA